MGDRDYEYFGVRRTFGAGGEYIYVFRAFFPYANFVELTGDFNSWRGEGLSRLDGGAWELIYKSDIPLDGMRYKYRVFSEDGVELLSDPFERYGEFDGERASIVHTEKYDWHDGGRKTELSSINIYCFEPQNTERYENYRELARKLGEYARKMKISHIMIKNPPFSPDPRFGNPDDLCFFTDYLHSIGVGVIMSIGGEMTDFLSTSAFFKLSEFHADGLFFGDISELLKKTDNIDFFAELNRKLHRHFPNVITIAEENTAFPGITGKDGLGFDLKVNRAWERAVLNYSEGGAKNGELIFSFRYAFGENYILPLPRGEHKSAVVLAYFFTYPGKKMIFRTVISEELENYMRKLSEIYASSAALIRGGFEWINESESPMIFRRTDGDEIVCILNFSGEKYTFYIDKNYRDLLNGEILAPQRIDIPPFGVMILSPEKNLLHC
ncbi:MAG: hypothetical protein E7640_03725 [Ruminococcaceae bacterium]|nr:hypothetical protein [Oscillospiraceae bacterium]